MALLHRTFDTELILNHNDLIQQLEAVYMDRINKLLKQKNVILMNLQKQFMQRRENMIRIASNKRNDPLHDLDSELKISENAPNGFDLMRISSCTSTSCPSQSDHQQDIDSHRNSSDRAQQIGIPPLIPLRQSTELQNKIKFQCTHPKCGCNKGFASKQSLHDHIKRVLGIKEICCEA